MDSKQKKLLEFFELIDKPTWLIQLRDIIRSRSMDVWDIDVKELAREYMSKIKMETDLNQLATAMLVCSILLKYKSNRIGLKELEYYIEEELEQIEATPEAIIPEEIKTDQISLEEFTKTLSKMAKTPLERKKYPKKKPEIYIPTISEDFRTTGLKLLEYLLQQTKTTFTYEELKKEANVKNNLFMTLLYLNDDEKVKLKQKELYGELKINIKEEKN